MQANWLAFPVGPHFVRCRRMRVAGGGGGGVLARTPRGYGSKMPLFLRGFMRLVMQVLGNPPANLPGAFLHGRVLVGGACFVAGG